MSERHPQAHDPERAWTVIAFGRDGLPILSAAKLRRHEARALAGQWFTRPDVYAVSGRNHAA